MLERVLEFCHALGLTCDGHEEDLLALFTAIEASRSNKGVGNGQQASDNQRIEEIVN